MNLAAEFGPVSQVVGGQSAGEIANRSNLGSRSARDQAPPAELRPPRARPSQFAELRGEISVMSQDLCFNSRTNKAVPVTGTN